MSRTLQLEEKDQASLRQELMTMDNLQLVAILEDATAKEINAQRLSARALHRLRVSEDTGKAMAAQHEAEMDRVIHAIYEECARGHADSTSILETLLATSFQALIGETGSRRTALARFMTKMITGTLNSVSASDPGDWADGISQQYYLIAALAQDPPAENTPARNWYARGHKIYTASEKTS